MPLDKAYEYNNVEVNYSSDTICMAETPAVPLCSEEIISLSLEKNVSKPSVPKVCSLIKQ